MNIQFCLFHRLDHLKLSPRYTTDLMGVAVQVEFFYPKISFDSINFVNLGCYR